MAALLWLKAMSVFAFWLLIIYVLVEGLVIYLCHREAKWRPPDPPNRDAPDYKESTVAYLEWLRNVPATWVPVGPEEHFGTPLDAAQRTGDTLYFTAEGAQWTPAAKPPQYLYKCAAGCTRLSNTKGLTVCNCGEDFISVAVQREALHLTCVGPPWCVADCEQHPNCWRKHDQREA